jgi:hypothetical protein
MIAKNRLDVIFEIDFCWSFLRVAHQRRSDRDGSQTESKYETFHSFLASTNH